jgi:alcohol dehydrogenase (NADP+)
MVSVRIQIGVAQSDLSTNQPTNRGDLMTTAAYAAETEKAPLGPFTLERRAVGPQDVRVAIDYCGVCHTDLHFVNNDWGMSQYPLVPGHEVVGHVVEVGDQVTRFKVGDRAAIGCMVDSCGACEACADDLEQFCYQGMTATYNSPTADPGGLTFGGYSKEIVATEKFVLRVPESLDLAATAPLLCAGITTYSPLKHWQIGPGMRVGVVGLGGLGHMGVKFAHAMGAETVMITTSPEKGADAKALGADEVLLSTDAEAMAAQAGRFHFILDTVPVKHDVAPYLNLLRYDGTLCLVGVVEPTGEVNAAQLVFGRKRMAGSLIGGLAETQEMLDFCGAHDVVADVEVIPMQAINEAYQRLVKSDVKYRFVIDMQTL